MLFSCEKKAGMRPWCCERAFGASLYAERGAETQRDAAVQLSGLFILVTFRLASVGQQLQGSSPSTNNLNSIRRPRASPTLLQTIPEPRFTRSSVTHVGREGATDNGFVSLHVIIGRLVAHFAVNVLVPFLLQEEFQ